MNKSNSNIMLPILERHKTGVHIFRWDFEEVTRKNPEGEDEKSYEYYEVWVESGNPKTTTEAVINALWGNGVEQKLMNDYNSAKEGVFSGDTATEAVDAYVNFLRERDRVKKLIDSAYSAPLQDVTE